MTGIKFCPNCNEKIKAKAVYCNHCGSNQKLADIPDSVVTQSDELTGQTILEYRITRKLGAGGMGAVYHGVHEALGQEVAIKILDPIQARNAELRERFMQEARIQVNLQHPGIVQVLTVNTTGAHLALVMEYVEGLSLEEVIERRGSLPYEEARSIFHQVLDAVGHAHKMRVVHRDLKPSNIMVRGDGVTKVMDFGIARVLGLIRLTQTGTAMGTALYMSPEQVVGRKDIDLRTDIYSLGVTFYEVLTGVPPFQGNAESCTESDYLIKQAHVTETPPDPRKYCPALSNSVAKALLKALEKDPRSRFQSCAEFRQALDGRASAGPVRPSHDPIDRRETASQSAQGPQEGGPGLSGRGGSALVTPKPPATTVFEPPHVEMPAPSVPEYSGPKAPAETVLESSAQQSSAGRGKSGAYESVPPMGQADLPGDSPSDMAGLKRKPMTAIIIIAVLFVVGIVVAVVLLTRKKRSVPSFLAKSRTTYQSRAGYSQTRAHKDRRLSRVSTSGMVLVPAGWFPMGSNRGVKDEKPVHRVYLNAYYIDKYEVTVKQYRRCVRAGSCSQPEYFQKYSSHCNWKKHGRGKHPINCVSWYDAKSYCQWAGKRLPTEAQWEKAARGVSGRDFPWGSHNPTCNLAVFDEMDTSKKHWGCGRRGTWPVGSKPGGASPYGAHDMAGNVWEWVVDWFEKSYYKRSPSRNPTGPSFGKLRVVRGGAWYSSAKNLRSTLRGTTRSKPHSFGFRCIKSQ